ncbi:endoplasmic reticulum-Golgi intermediate compartment organization [Mactra antiquata]
MATFERMTDRQSSVESVEHKKYPLARLELSIQKFFKVIQIDLARLHRHKLNAEQGPKLAFLGVMC